MNPHTKMPFIGPMLTDGGLETELIFKHGLQLPHFAAFTLLNGFNGTEVIRNYYRGFLDLAKKYGTGFILETPTWRANRDWAYKLGYSENELEDVNLRSVKLMADLKEEYKNTVHDVRISGNIGPRADGYSVLDGVMSTAEAKEYHSCQINSFKKASVDHVTALTINYMAEAQGIVQAAKECGVPVVLSFTTETDGKLPSGENLKEVIHAIDKDSNCYPSYYMLNCAHPTHFIKQFNSSTKWSDRIMGVRANASCKSHEELDNSEELDSGDKVELSNWYAKLRESLPNLHVFGGCCGTDTSHIEAICDKLLTEKNHE